MSNKKPLTAAQKKKRIAIWTIALIAMFCLVPPWSCQSENTSENVGFGPLFAPPRAHGHAGNVIDTMRLAVECFAVAAIGAGLIYSKK